MGAPATQNWKAWEDRQPITPPEGATLHVSGEVETNNGGIVPELTPTNPPGLNPTILSLDLTLRDTGPGTTDIAYRPAKYEQPVSPDQYKQVHILWEGKTIAETVVEIVE